MSVPRFFSNDRRTNAQQTAMIISASRRTDLPALYSEWFMNRVRAGWCAVPNPFNSKQVSRVGLSPEEVDAFVFWTREPRPMLPYLQEIEDRGYKFYFQVTLLDYPRLLHPNCPTAEAGISAIQELSAIIGADRIVWRYDPIILNEQLSVGFHAQKFGHLAEELRGCVRHCVFSTVEIYRKNRTRLQALRVLAGDHEDYDTVIRQMVEIAREQELPLKCCSPPSQRRLPAAVEKGACVDPVILNGMGVPTSGKTDPGQRDNCGCRPSRDIGMYESCSHGCVYCYATNAPQQAWENMGKHDPASPSMLGYCHPPQGNLLDI